MQLGIFSKGYLSYTDLENMPIPRIFELYDVAEKIGRDMSKSK